MFLTRKELVIRFFSKLGNIMVMLAITAITVFAFLGMAVLFA